MKCPPPIGIYEDLKALLVNLHKVGFVHGDVRDTNIMVRKDRKPGFMLLDFDWSGLVGGVRYPMNVFRGPREIFFDILVQLSGFSTYRPMELPGASDGKSKILPDVRSK